MYLKDLIRRSSRNLLNAKARTLLTAFAIAVGTFALTLTLAASNGAQAYVNKIIANNFDPTELIVTNDPSIFGRTDSSAPQEYNQSISNQITASGNVSQVRKLSDNDLDRLKDLPGVEAVNESVSVGLQYITRPGQRKYTGSLQVFTSSQNPELLAGSIAKPLLKDQIIIPEGYLNVLGFTNAAQAVGQKVTLAVQKQFDPAAVLSELTKSTTSGTTSLGQQATPSMEEDFTVIAVTKKPTTVLPGAALGLYAGKEDVKRLNDYTTKDTADYHKYLTANVKVRDGNDKTKLTAVQQEVTKLGYGAQSVVDTQKFLTQIISVLQGIVTAFGFISVVASLFGIVNTMYISVLQRTREIGLMKALGMRKKDITKLFRFEAALIGLLGGLLGSLSAVLLGIGLNPWITKKLSLGQQHLLVFRPSQILVLIAVLIVVATLAGLLPARKASRLDPIEALRTE